jgi:beta-galactosidase/beta-glucuronidase
MGVAVGEEWLSGVDTWGGRKAEPAVVNPVVCGAMQEVISLRGEWEFITKGVAPLRQPRWYGFYAQAWPGSRSIEVPGCWEVQGVGELGPSETWDCKWDHGPREIRNVYMGEAWYRKRVEIPAEWAGKRVWLKIGGVRSQGWFWVNNKTVALVDNYCGTYKYDITDLVEPGGEAVVVAAVNNSTPSRKGQMVSSHKFGGLYRRRCMPRLRSQRRRVAWRSRCCGCGS